MMPSRDQTGTPSGVVAFAHFRSSTTPGSASRMRARILASVFPLQSPGSAALPAFLGRSFMFASLPLGRGLEAAPEEVRETPEHEGARGPAPRLRSVTH